MAIARDMWPQSILGIDIDPSLINKARKVVNQYASRKGAIHILRNYFYNTKLNLTSQRLFKPKEFLFQHYIMTKFSCCSLIFLVHKEKYSKNS